MSIFSDLASVLDENDELSNKERARLIAESNDKKEIKELVARLSYQNRAIQSDSIKVLYEIGYIKPQLLLPYLDLFLDLLSSKNNRMVWGCMIALSCISTIESKKLYPHLSKILQAVDEGSVITKDAAVSILINLSKLAEFHLECSGLYFKYLQNSPPNQFPMYAEKGMEIIDHSNRNEFCTILEMRLDQLDKDSQKKRILKVLKKLERN